MSSNKITAHAAEKWTYPTSGQPANPAGEGTTASPYLITSAQELANVSYLINHPVLNGTYGDKVYKLMADIVLNATVGSGQKWTPIGNGQSFSGTFDGNGHTISGVYIDTAVDNSMGLFGNTEATATIKNLGIKNSSIVATDNSTSFSIGGIVGVNKGAITNCYNLGAVTGKQNVGGLVGNNSGTITNCYNLGDVNGTSTNSADKRVGGLVGNNSGVVANSYNQGAVTAAGMANVGGIVGAGGTVTNCYSTGNVTGKSLVGGVAGSGTVTNCYFLKVANVTNSALNAVGTTTTTKTSACGSFEGNGGTLTAEVVGSIIGGKTQLLEALNAGKDAYNTANPSAIPAVAWFNGLGGYPSFTETKMFKGAGTKDDPYQIGTAEHIKYLAQEVNRENTAYTDKHYKMTADIALNNTTNWKNWNKDTLGLNPWTPIGIIAESNVEKPFKGTFDGDGHNVSGIYMSNGGSNIGLFGFIEATATVKNVGVIKSYINGGDNIGGVVGANKGTIINCYNSGVISGVGTNGGVVGTNSGKITNCYNTGAVTGTYFLIGGVVGNNFGEVLNCYNSGNVIAGNFAGGVAGKNANTGEIANCYYLQTRSINDGKNLVGTRESGAKETNCSQFTSGNQLNNNGQTDITSTIALVKFNAGEDLIKILNAGTEAYNNKTPAIKAKEWYGVTGGGAYFVPSVYVDTVNKIIYANGFPITIKAGGTPGNTNIFYDTDLKNPIDLTGLPGVTGSIAGGFGLTEYPVYGGGNTPIIGDTSVTIESGIVKSIYGGGVDASATVSGTKTVNVSGSPTIGAATDPTSGIIINGGSVTNGVDKFTIIKDIFCADGAIQLVLPSGYINSTVATKNTGANFLARKFKLVGDGAKDKLLEIEGDNLKVVTDLITVEIVTTKQTSGYEKTGKSFVVTSTTDGVTDGFTVLYRKNGVNEAYSSTLPINAGQYDVKVTRAADTVYAALNKEILNGLVITPIEARLDWAYVESYVYDGTPKIPGVTVGNLVYLDKCTVTAGVTGGKNNTDVGSFTFTATALDNPNYKITTKAISDPYIITARPLKNITVSKVADTTVDFSNIALTVDNCDGLFDTDVVTITFKTSSADKGTYTGSEIGKITEFTIAGTDKDNYSFTVADLTATITGKPIPAFTAMTSKEYTKLAQKPTVTIAGLTLGTNYTLSWKYKVAGGTEFNAVTGEPEFINAGTYKVTATGLGEYDGSTQTAEYEITAKEVTLHWGGTANYFYTGKPIVPNVDVTNAISGDSCEVTVIEPTVADANIKVGTFIMKAKALSNSNYKLSANPVSGEYGILKRDNNRWLTPLSIANIYVGGTLAPNAEPIIGEVVYTYFTDKDGKKDVEFDGTPAEIGTYWVTAKVAGNDNYVGIDESEAVQFKINRKPADDDDSGSGSAIPPKDILWTGIINNLKHKNDPIVEFDSNFDKVPKAVLLALQDVDKTLKLSSNGETLVITSKQVKPLTFDKAMYSFAELKAMLEVKPEITPTPTPTPTEKPTEPTEPTAKKCWLCGACPMFLGLCLWIWLAIAVVAAAVVVFIVVKKKKKNDKK